MNVWHLIRASLLRRRARTGFTLLSIVVAFVLFGLLVPLHRMFESRVDLADADRLIVTNKMSLLRPLPISYYDRLEQLPNVELASHFTFFGAFYREPSKKIASTTTDVSRFRAMVDEVEFRDEASYDRWLQDPTSVAIGRQLADRFGWKVGDLVPVYSSIYQRADGSPAWTFRVATIFDAVVASGNSDSMIIHHSYFDQARAAGIGTVGWYSIRIADPEKAAATANAIDDTFANSSAETHTTTEKAFAQSFLRQVGDFGEMIGAALLLVFYTLMLVVANTMAQSVRERHAEFGVLKALGYSGPRLLGLVLMESLVLMICGGLFGLGVAALLIPRLEDRTDMLLSTVSLGVFEFAAGLAVMTAVAFIVALAPAIRAARHDPVQALREAT